MGQSPDSSSYNSDCIGVPLVQGNADITDGVTTPLRYTSQPTKICKKGSILLSVRAPVGTVCIADREVCLGRGVCAINSENNAFVRQLFLYLEPSWCSGPVKTTILGPAKTTNFSPTKTTNPRKKRSQPSLGM